MTDKQIGAHWEAILFVYASLLFHFKRAKLLAKRPFVRLTFALIIVRQVFRVSGVGQRRPINVGVSCTTHQRPVLCESRENNHALAGVLWFGQPTPATAAPNDPVARTEFPLLASRKETVPVGATVPPASVTVPVSV